MNKDLENLKQTEDLLQKKPPRKLERLSAQKRLELLFDDGKFKHLFRFVRSDPFKDKIDNNLICASGRVNGQDILAYACEFNILGGSLGVQQGQQIIELYRLAKQSGLPLIALYESGGARVSDGIHISDKLAECLAEATFASGVIPQLTCILGHCIGASAYMAMLNDFIIMDEKATLCIAGSSVNKAATGEDVTEFDMGGAEVHKKQTGNAHFVEKTEEECIERLRQLLSYMPANNAEVPATIVCHDSEERIEKQVYDLLPAHPSAPFDMKQVIQLFVDNHDFFELQEAYAPNAIIGFARFGGMPVGIIANQSLHLAGALDTLACKKFARFINFLGIFNYPLISFVDVPGAIPTVEQHKAGILTHGTQLLQSIGHLKTLKISIVVRRCFGAAYCLLNPKCSGGDIIYAYPNAMMGSMSDKAMSSFSGMDPRMAKKVEALHAMGKRLDDPFIAASYGYIDDVIDPAQTRPEIIQALQAYSNKRFREIPPKWLNNPPF